jgi:hypothetical protein
LRRMTRTRGGSPVGWFPSPTWKLGTCIRDNQLGGSKRRWELGNSETAPWSSCNGTTACQTDSVSKSHFGIRKLGTYIQDNQLSGFQAETETRKLGNRLGPPQWSSYNGPRGLPDGPASLPPPWHSGNFGGLGVSEFPGFRCPLETIWKLPTGYPATGSEFPSPGGRSGVRSLGSRQNGSPSPSGPSTSRLVFFQVLRALPFGRTCSNSSIVQSG